LQQSARQNAEIVKCANFFAAVISSLLKFVAAELRRKRRCDGYFLRSPSTVNTLAVGDKVFHLPLHGADNQTRTAKGRTRKT